MIESVRDMDIFIEYAIQGVLAKAMHSGDGGHGMIFKHFKKSRLNIRDSCFSIIELKKDIFIKISATVLVYKTIVVGNQNNKHGIKRNVLKLRETSAFKNVMINAITLRVNKIINGRFKMNIHGYNYNIIDFFKDATDGIEKRKQSCVENH